MLTVENLDSGYGSIPVLTGLSLSVSQGEFVGILGHNGMGKTTLLKTLIGILPATAGKITFAGNVITSAPAHRRARAGMGYVPQGRGILPGLTVRDNLLFAAAAVGARRSGQLEEALDDFPRLKAYLDRPGGALSGGEQQLLALARTLIQKPSIVLLDEPTEGIQPSIIDEIVDQMKGLRQRRGLTILLVEQNVDFIRALSDRVLLIHKGTITNEFSVDALTDTTAMGDFSSVEH
ncbi:ABC transporter ATP-binding protein [Mesorhizobium sp. YIM 152430]|uniref:ABC transporter ATP-binding protein n=1 Tax=Mesorhizobium sp. YIM 152430 TaxID=3031761 RepID=UPI0023DA7F7B|nr:ABC transporter ATP-binding protein [Mesorhizobium sp. YIM 152430]MBL0937203.1 ABC transporter ATP-binding protein [Rhizobiaceae bacterium]MDF1599169.1 ABC transporter ATP-binding protein [Mesorhizobium sp. YIM 152430]